MASEMLPVMFAMPVTLPQSIVFTPINSGKYLKYTTDGYVTNEEVDILNTMCRIVAETSKVDARYVHLRFCYSNKYWSRDEADGRLRAISTQPEEDTSKPSCTLFEAYYLYCPVPGPPVFDGTFFIRQVQSLLNLSSPSEDDLVSIVPSGDTKFKYVAWDTLTMIPKYVAFKGDNGKYLRAAWIDGIRYLQFSSADATNKDTGHEVTVMPDGHIRLKSDLFGLFWRRSPNWIWADSQDTTDSNKDTLFWPVQVTGNVFALRNAGNNAFCCRLTTDGKESCLNASTDTIVAEAKLTVEELVLEKQIFNVKFRTEDARIYDEKPIILGSEQSENETTELKSSVSIEVGYESSTSSTFTKSFSLGFGVKTDITTGIPFIADGKIEVSTETSFELEWSKTTTVTSSSHATYTTDVPPLSIVTVQYLATQGKCDVPFDYTMTQKLSRDGSLVTTQHDDGIYTGLTSYNFHFTELQPQPIS